MGKLMIEKINRLSEGWHAVKKIIPYGSGLEAYRSLKRIIEDFDVPYIVDRDESKKGQLVYGVPVTGLEGLQNVDTTTTKIVITIAKRRYQEIKEELEQLGFQEYVDFCHISQFAIEWYYKYKNEYSIFSMDIAITTRCTLQCKNCNMFTPYYKNHVTYSFEEIKNSLDLFFERIDYVFEIGILGGEVFLNKDLRKIIIYMFEQYNHKFGSLCITTNGTMIPNQQILDTLKQYNVITIISDYKQAIQQKNKIEELLPILKEADIIYNIRKDLVWCDFGFPGEPYDIPDEQAKEHMLNCDPGWRGLNDGKFYFCNVAWSANKAGLFQLKKEDYIDLADLNPDSEEDKLKILKYSLGILPQKYMSFCKACGGCGADNKNYVNAGEQL